GTLKSAAAGPGDKLCSGGYTAPSVIADVDVDDQLELVHGGSIWTWNAIADDMVLEPYWMGNFTGAFTAVADFGDFPGLMGDGPGRAEVVAMSPGSVRVHTIGGDLLFGPAALPGGGDGGNITIADFDGDGAPEFGVVGSTRYVVYDPACGDPMFEGECGTMTDNGILWQAVIDENSCAIMGSTVFDFEGDGAAEVVYADECYIRVYEGKTGGVVWSHPRSSATWYDAPIVVDSDGDGRAELISPFSPYGNGGCPAIDPSFEGLRCTEQFACPGDALTCDEGLCRCVEDVDCGDPDMVCTAALPQSPGVGNVCRPKFSVRTGLRVYSDVNWVGSRTIWNQHAYSVTNVNTDGTIPKGSEVERNWQVEGLNNFRQNVQDELGIVSGPDLTVEAIGFNQDCSADNPLLSIQAEVCNRGEVVVDPPIEVNFYDGDPEMGGALLCTAETTIPLVPGDCEIVACLYPNPPLDEPIEIHVRVDEKGVVTECLEGNNSGSLIAQCPPPPPE
ncbi:MAG: VCBS repeat-containing protein, partial [Myxococcales bacterium]|nr:VCBS repeat-containing protein [Myxococcales bacterium]